MLKIFLTGDNHIGLKYSGHRQSALLVEARLSAFDRMVATANADECDLFVIAGDLFENTYSITKRDVTRLFESLRGFHGTVAVLPGNHDYYDADVKVWQTVREAICDVDNILLMTEYRPYTVMCGEQEAVLYPALCTSLHSDAGQNNLGWVAEQSMDRTDVFHIGIAHGAVEGETIDHEGQYFLMTRKDLDAIPVDVWLIGHTHVPFPRNLPSTMTAVDERVFNAGTHVQTDVSCSTDGLCFEIEIDDDKQLRAKAVPSGDLWFKRLHVSLTAGTMAQTLEETLAPLDDRTVVDLILSGAVSAQEYENRRQIVSEALSRFVEGGYHDYGLSRMITKELIETEFPETSFSAGLLGALIEQPKEAQLMYELLQSLKGGA